MTCKLKSLLTIVVLLMASTAYGAVATFDDLTLASESYWNGSDESGGFQSGDAWFKNAYNSSWGSWSGWAYSNTTDTTTAGWTNQYSAYTGGGAEGSSNYGVAFSQATLNFVNEDYNSTISGAYITNTTYAALSMLNGDSFAKKFGGDTGNDEDWFKVTFKGITETGYTANSVEFYLADYRFADNTQDYIVDEWTWVDFTGLGDIIGIEANLSSSDVGAYGMNTPAYFAMDSLNAVPVPAAAWLFAIGLLWLVGIRRRR